jgi:integrase
VTGAPRSRGRPRKPRPPRRERAVSPFLPTVKALEALPATSPLRRALSALPDPADNHDGPLAPADVPVDVPGVRFEITAEQAGAAQAYLEGLKKLGASPYAANSLRSIRADWRHWLAFCAIRKRVAMPIATDDLTDFIDALIGAGYQRATLEHLVFTLKLASEIWACPPPTQSRLWKAFWKDRCRSEALALRQRQAQPLNADDLEVVAEETSPEDPRALRDLAFVAVAYDLLARASEMVALRWSDLDFEADPVAGGAVATISRSKTDQEGRGAEGYLQASTVVHLRAWRAVARPENPYVFHALPRYQGHALEDATRPLNVREAGRIFVRAGQRGALGKRLSAHSARVGGAQDMTHDGMDLPAIMQAGRWRTPVMPARYAENELAVRAGQARGRARKASKSR